MKSQTILICKKKSTSIYNKQQGCSFFFSLVLRSIGKSGFRILHSNAKSENAFYLREIRRQGGFQLRNPNPDFMDFFVTIRLENPKKDIQNYLRELWSSYC